MKDLIPSEVPQEPHALSAPPFRVPKLDAERMRSALASKLFGAAPTKTFVGAYEIRRRLGMGGMGVVYAGYDARLNREVALKVIHDRQSNANSARRLLAEAKALARLSHPNIVQVFEVGEFQGQVFVVMELLPGKTLRSVQREDCDNVQTWLAPWLDAAEGLYAAHLAGLVHRDFKPENAMLLPDGSVKVLDFGLALVDPIANSLAQTEQLLPVHSFARSSQPHLGQRAAAIEGTPAFMAPEQLSGLPCTPRSDQFSYCVALWESFAGTRPFQGSQTQSLLDAILSFQIDHATARRMPRWLRNVLYKGLSPDPSARFASMDRLKQALMRGAGARKQTMRWLAVGAPLALATVFGVNAALTQDPCESAARAWDDLEELSQIEPSPAQLASKSSEYLSQTLSRLRRELQSYTQEGKRRHVQACRIALESSSLQSASFAAQTSCFSAAARAVPAFVARLKIAGADELSRFASTTSPLPSLDSCESTRIPAGQQEQRQRRMDLETRLAKAQVSLAFFDLDRAENGAKSLIQDADGKGVEGLLVRSLLLQANIMDARQLPEKARTFVDRAYRLSMSLDDPGLRLQAAVDRSKIMAHGGHSQEAVAQLRDIYPLAQREDVGLDWRFSYFERACVIEKHAYALCETYSRCKEGVKLAREKGAPARYQEAISRGLAWILLEWGELDRMVTVARDARALLAAKVGSDSLLLAQSDFWLVVLEGDGLNAKASPPSAYAPLIPRARKSLEQFRQMYGHNSRLARMARHNLAEMLRRGAEFEEAEALFKQLLSDDKEDHQRYFDLVNYGRMLVQLERMDEAKVMLQEALIEIDKRAPPGQGGKHQIVERAEANFALAKALGYKQGLPHAQKALEVYELMHQTVLKERNQPSCQNIKPGVFLFEHPRRETQAWIAKAKGNSAARP